MIYDLAKKLKDAGFPKMGELTNTGVADLALSEEVPTLSELIEACGEEFLELCIGKYKKSHSKKSLFWAYTRKILFWKSIKRYILKKSVAGSTNDMGWQWVFKGEGPTPEEAVANLWLVLNKK